MKLRVYFLLADAEDVEKVKKLEMPEGFDAVPYVWDKIGTEKDNENEQDKNKEKEKEKKDKENEKKEDQNNEEDKKEKKEKKTKEIVTLPFCQKRSAALHLMFRKTPPAAIISICPDNYHYLEMLTMPFEYRKRWLRYSKVSEVRPEFITECWSYSHLPLMLDMPNTHHQRNPLICAISSTYHSKERILRPYHSLRSQTYSHWRWIIVDDSRDGDDETWLNLKKLAETDSRIEVLRCSHHSGYIGKMKALASGVAVAMGAKWIVELDHDDIIVPELFQWIVTAATKYPEVGFIHTDFVELYEKNEAPFCYRGVFGFGYGCYINQRVNGRWQHVYQSHMGNDPILNHYITGVANHARVWRADIYVEVGGYSPYLPVADDYELLLRTFFKTKCLRIAENGYLQFRNEVSTTNGQEAGGNFTFHRNALIQVITTHVSYKYRPMMNKRAIELFQRPANNSEHVPRAFQCPTRRFKNADIVWFPGIEDTVAIVMPTYNRSDMLRRAITSVLSQDYKQWKLYVIGDACPVLDTVMQAYNDPRIMYWNLDPSEKGGAGGHAPRNYAIAGIVTTPWVFFLDDDNWWEPNHISSCIQRRNACPGVRCVVSSMKINNRPLYFDEPKVGRVDTSCLFVDTELVRESGAMKNRIEGGYAHDHEWVSRWMAQPKAYFASTLMPTVNYEVSTNAQSYEQLYSWYPDQPELAKTAAMPNLTFRNTTTPLPSSSTSTSSFHSSSSSCSSVDDSISLSSQSSCSAATPPIQVPAWNTNPLCTKTIVKVDEPKTKKKPKRTVEKIILAVAQFLMIFVLFVFIFSNSEAFISSSLLKNLH